MNKAALVLTSAALMLTATTAAAQETEPPPESFEVSACGSTLTFEVLKDNFKFREGEMGFAATGNFTVRISDEDSSVVVPVPGRVSGEATETGGIVTDFGRTLLFPDPSFPFVAEAIAEAGLPEVSLIIGKLVRTDTVIDDVPIDTEITSINGRVVDVCELLAR